MPIMIEKNDYGVNLFNGDIGIFPDQKQNNELIAWFKKSDGLIDLSPPLTSLYKLAYAMTVHRSQGSEYDKVMIILPNHPSEILSRHLLYVACSRASKVTLLAQER